MNATIKIERWIKDPYKNIEIRKQVTECYGIKRKEIIKQIKKIIKEKKDITLFIGFTVINHSEKKVEYITKYYKFIKYKERYAEELLKLERGE